MSEEELHTALWDIIHKLFDKRVVLDFTDHLSDRELYCLNCEEYFVFAGEEDRKFCQLFALGLFRCQRRRSIVAALLRHVGRA